MSVRFTSGSAQASFLIEIFSHQLGYKVEAYGGIYSLTPLKSEFAASEEELGKVMKRILQEHHLEGKTFSYKYLDKAK